MERLVLWLICIVVVEDQNENWSAKRIHNRIEVYIDDDLRFLEHEVRSNEKMALLSTRVKSSIFGTIVITGPRTKVLDETDALSSASHSVGSIGSGIILQSRLI